MRLLLLLVTESLQEFLLEVRTILVQDPYPVGHPLNQGPSGQAAARIAADAKIKSYADASAAGKGIGSKYTTKKASTKAAVSSYRSNKAGTISTPTFKPNYDATKGPLRF